MSTEQKPPLHPTSKSRHGGVAMPRGHMMSMGPVEKPQDFSGTLRKLVAYLSPYTLKIGVVMFLAIGSTLFSIVGPKILGNATTTLFNGLMSQLAGTGSIDFQAIERILLTALGLYVLSAILSYAQGWLMTDVAMQVAYQLRKELMAKIHRMPFRYFDGTTYGEVLSRLTNDVDTVNRTLNQSLTQIVTSAVTVLGILAMMLDISWQMTVVALLIVPISFAVMIGIIKSSQKYFAQQQEYLGHVNGIVEESFGGHIIVKAFNKEKENIDTFNGYNRTLYGSAWKAQFFSSIIQPLMRLIGNFGYVVVVVLGGWLAVQDLITVGDIQAFIQYMRSFTQPITQLANISNILQQTIAAAERVFEFLEEEEEVPDPAHVLRIDPNHVKGHVEFRNVYFGYLPDKPVIKGFSATIHPGQKVAIVGPTGAGKTTLVKLLMRFYDVNEGAILVEGHDVREYARADLRRLFGMVLQDTWLFNGTIMENIRYGRLDATDEEVIAAAQTAHADHFIRALSGGYDFVINEEVTNISQGQKQLLTIARAILANPPIMILDEATSSVDTHTELLIQSAMDKLMHGRTSFVIAHRLSTIRNADIILVIRDGNIVEQGTHEELLAKGGFYAELYNSQFESRIEEAQELAAVLS